MRSIRITGFAAAAALAAIVAIVATAAPASAQVEYKGLYYKEIAKDGRVYVFNTPERAKSFEESGEIGVAITLPGAAVNGDTLVGENETAIDLYNWKHDLQPYERPTPKAEKPSKYPSTKIQGRFYGDFTSKEVKNKGTGATSSDTGVGVDVKRFYFTVTHSFDEKWSAQFQSDIGDQGAKRYDVFVKKAFLEYAQSDAFKVRLGSADTPWIPFAEGVYGMRYFEQTITDTLGFGTSADWGVHVLGSAMAGKLAYQVSGINGKGYSNPGRTKSIDFEGRVSFKPVTGFTLGLGGYSGKLGNDLDTASPAKHTAQRLNGLAAYSSDRFGVGVEIFQAKNWKNVTSTATDKAEGTSVFAHVNVAPGMKVFARYDQAKPSKDFNDKLKLDYYNLGFERRFNKSFAASLGYKYAQVKGGTISTGNGSIGSAVAGRKGEYSEIGFWGVYDF